MIIITGATGQLGRPLVQQLLTRLPAEQVGVSVRDPEMAADLAGQGVRVRQGDFSDPDSLATAFEGASRVLIVSTDGTGGTAVEKHQAAIDSAKAAGASRIFYTSHVGARPISAFSPMPDHAAAEQALQDSGVPFTSLRNGFYAAFAPTLLGDAVESGELRAPEDGPISWTTHADLAEAAAIALTDETLDETELNLTGAEAVDLAGVAAIVSEIKGRPIKRVVVPDDEYRTGLINKGLPEARVDILMGMFGASRRGDFARVDPTLERMIGRSPVSLHSVLTDALAS